jgi:hypothetical protein
VDFAQTTASRSVALADAPVTPRADRRFFIGNGDGLDRYHRLVKKQGRIIVDGRMLTGCPYRKTRTWPSVKKISAS